MSDDELESRQRILCERFGAAFVASDLRLKVGISRSALEGGVWPVNGLRHSPERGTSGWFIWAGEEWSTAADFFLPLHGDHLADACPHVLPYLGLAPGWRFLLAPEHEDVWHDAGLTPR